MSISKIDLISKAIDAALADVNSISVGAFLALSEDRQIELTEANALAFRADPTALLPLAWCDAWGTKNREIVLWTFDTDGHEVAFETATDDTLLFFLV